MSESSVTQQTQSIGHSDSPRDGKLGVVIVNWNSGSFLRACLRSFARCEWLDRVSMIVVVDNDSHDGSCRDLPALSVPIRWIQNESNVGFAAACNQGAAICESSYLLFLNPDSELHANSLRGPLEYMDDPLNAQVGICGIQLIDDRNNVARTCSRLPTSTSLVAMATRMHSMLPRIFLPHFMKEWDHGTNREVEQVIGAFFFVRRDLFTQLEGFDERFFVYYEEVDFCARARQLGYRTMFLSTAQASHSGGGCSSQIRSRSLFYSLRSRILYANKHFSTVQARMVAISTFVLEPAIRIASLVLSFRFKNLKPLVEGFALLWWDRFVGSRSTNASVVSNRTSNRDASENSTSLTKPGEERRRTAA